MRNEGYENLKNKVMSYLKYDIQLENNFLKGCRNIDESLIEAKKKKKMNKDISLYEC